MNSREVPDTSQHVLQYANIKDIPASIRLSSTLLWCLGMTLQLTTFSKIQTSLLPAVGTGAIFLILAVSIFALFVYQTKCSLPPRIVVFLLPAGLLVTDYIIGCVLRFDTRGIEVLFQLFAVCVFYVVMRMIEWKDQAIRTLASISAIGLYLHPLIWFVTGHHIAEQGVTHSNVVGMIVYHASILQVLAILTTKSTGKRLFYFSNLLFALIILLLTHARSLWLAVVLMCAIALCWRLVISNRWIFRLCILIALSIVVMTTYVYPTLKSNANVQQANDAVMAESGKSLFSGRDRIWAVITTLVLQQPWTGYGAGALPHDFIDDDISSHNLYLQVALQVGIVGSCLLFWMLIALWELFWPIRNSPYARIGAAFLLGSILIETLEITLTQNNLTVGLNQWLILAICTSKAEQLRSHKLGHGTGLRPMRPLDMLRRRA